jgi:hypothetical protein
VLLPPATPFTDQVTDVLKLPVPVTVAPHCEVCDTCTEVGVQLTDTPVTVALEVTVTLALPLWVESCVLVALMATTAGEGTVAGAVYLPLEEIVPTEAFPPLTPFTDHVTVVLKAPVPVSVAEHCDAWPVCTLEGLQLTDTDVMVGFFLPVAPTQPATQIPIRQMTNPPCLSRLSRPMVILPNSVQKPSSR